MCKFEKNLNRIYSISGIILIIVVIMAMTSCGINRGLTTEQVDKRDKIDYELDKLYLEYSYQRDSLIMEFYNVDCENCDEID